MTSLYCQQSISPDTDRRHCPGDMIGSEYRLKDHSTCYLHTDLHRLAARYRGSADDVGRLTGQGKYVASEMKRGD